MDTDYSWGDLEPISFGISRDGNHVNCELLFTKESFDGHSILSSLQVVQRYLTF